MNNCLRRGAGIGLSPCEIDIVCLCRGAGIGLSPCEINFDCLCRGAGIGLSSCEIDTDCLCWGRYWLYLLEDSGNAISICINGY